jgi:hypothetical protein
VTTVADLLSDRDRRRLAERLAELRELDGAMRQPGGMPAVPPPRPLHKMAAAAASTTTTADVRPEPPGGSTEGVIR